ncbi:hypothetical protein LY90DRAFT_500326 [Neocallimastix californiae]|uniref:Uncharacterized protein n=1 Tax=Neocallimastix californiae TaxID=1754190 RepID=A0A1Y2F9E1_9FUNG|nr:hypothetical protein LY90DRAFT_500326 [Neocallimastix californiae]|eukprot:ORY80552.1 hypothetical protein LY90DRAFT_500326 [Neocallimastix californiae]
MAKKKSVSPNHSSESIVSVKAQSNSIEKIHNDSKSASQNSLENLDMKINDIISDKKPASYEITTTYKTELVDCTVDPNSGDIIEVLTEIFVTDTMNLKKQESDIKESTDNLTASLDLDDVLKQLNFGTEICKELLG